MTDVLDFDKQNGLIAAVVQDAATQRVLMVGYMNREALTKTLATGNVTFFSRSRQKLWTKGESSGHVLKFKSIATDCDGDALLVQAEPLGPGVCHDGYESCFYRTLKDGEWVDQRRARLRSGCRSMESNSEAETRHSERQPGKRDHRSVPPRRLQYHHQQPQLLSRPSMIPKSNAC